MNEKKSLTFDGLPFPPKDEPWMEEGDGEEVRRETEVPHQLDTGMDERGWGWGWRRRGGGGSQEKEGGKEIFCSLFHQNQEKRNHVQMFMSQRGGGHFHVSGLREKEDEDEDENEIPFVFLWKGGKWG